MPADIRVIYECTLKMELKKRHETQDISPLCLFQVSIKTALLLRPGNSLRGQIRCATGEDLGSGSGSAVPSNGIRQLVAFSAQLMSPPQPELQAQPSTAVEAEAVLKWQERGAGRGGERTESSSEKRIQYSQVRTQL